jgi:hypothetical protein
MTRVLSARIISFVYPNNRRLRGGPAILLALLAAFVTSVARARAQSLPRAPGTKIINLTGEGYYDEPSIAINPENPQQLVAAYQVTAHAAYSQDGGEHWATAKGTAPPNFRVSGDVSVTYDNRGHAYLCYIAFDKLGTWNYWAHNATRNGIFVRRSMDGGKTWEASDVPVIEHASDPGIPFEDKPYIVADNSNGPYAGNLYVGWTRFTLDKTVILLSRSTDGDQTWSAPQQISAVPGLPRDDNGALEGFTGAVGADSTLYVAWADAQGIIFTSSRDGGKSFSEPVRVIETAPPYFKVEDVDRANGFPELGIDPRTNRLYLLWSDYRNGDVDVFCSTSDDRGVTWSKPVRVNSDPIHDGTDQFFQWLAVDPETGAANVIFYDRRGDPGNKQATVTLARSADGGKTFANYAWTTNPFDAHEEFIGDYTGIAAFSDRVYGVWAEEVGSSGMQKLESESAGRAAHAPSENFRSHHTVVRVGMADFRRNP